VCGQPLQTAAELSQLWDPPAYEEPTNGNVVDLYPESSIFASSQATTPLHQTVPYTFTEQPTVAEAAADVEPPPEMRPGGPPGWLLGLIGILIIVGIALLFFYLASEPGGFDFPSLGSLSIR
jgi:hypothetical protein